MNERKGILETAAALYIRDNFQSTDRLAVVLLHKPLGAVIQRISTAERIAGRDIQAWLRDQNARRYDVYISMNSLVPEATGRTKADVEAIRHIYLDFDHDGTAAVGAMLRRDDVPEPNYILSTSPDKWQVVWKVEGFTKDHAEELQRGLTRETGADPAATDCARVLRLPGFHNHKYARPYLVGVEARAKEVYGPNRFPVQVGLDRGFGGTPHPRARRAPGTALTQSERDWAFAKRSLARGESPELVVAAIASYRRYDKADPYQYAALTVRKAALESQMPGSPAEPPERS